MDCLVKVKPKPKTKKLVNHKKRQIGLLGGTFNPVHLAHLVMADQVLNQLKLDEVWFIPNNVPPQKDQRLTASAIDRCQMLKLAIQNHPKFSVKMIEIARGGISYTVETLRILKKQAPENNYYLILGSDQVARFSTWQNPDEIAHLSTLVGVRRPGYPQKSDYPLIWVDAPYLAISSTAIRRALVTGNSIHYLVPESVRQYIMRRGLYRD